jgi:hypothetical protein
MSLPRASDIAARTGVAQSVIHSKTPRVDKKEEEARRRPIGDDEEGEKGLLGAGPQAGKGPGGAKGAPAEDGAKKPQVRRKRVKLSELTGKKAGTAKSTAEVIAQKEVQGEPKAAKPQPGQLNPEEAKRLQAQARLNERANLAQTQSNFRNWQAQNGQGQPGNPNNPSQMLNNLISMQKNQYLQHTGDGIYNRASTRQILAALEGLRKGGSNGETKSTSSSSDSRGSNSTASLSPAAHKAKTAQASRMLEVFMRDDRQPPPGYEPTELVA